MGHTEYVNSDKFTFAVLPVGDNQLIEVGDIDHSLGFSKSFEASDTTALGQAEDLDGIVAQGRKKYPFICEVDRKVVDASFDRRDWNRLHQAKRLSALRSDQASPSSCAKAKAEAKNEARYFHAFTFTIPSLSASRTAPV